ncbi:C40 family peptidase [Anaerococcus sp. AGMB00486]|uniref:C40 family peptidase n=2 Tax=Anaerococcus TaxID=165779 RepID=A0ABX2N6X7_9FIRM|nr:MULTISPECIES: C40 family peptidase [Anaerococcus]MSS77069.1 SH3 domain-containing protein [Anaerococcus porci]NVF10441.1 C40 family peptidase [Anaerococcus faecalis]
MSKKNIGSTIGVLAAVTIGATAYASTMNNLDKEDQSKKVLDSNVSYVDSNLASKVETVKKDYANEVKNTKFAEKDNKSNRKNEKIETSRNLADPSILESSSEQAIVKAVDKKIKENDVKKIEEDTISNVVEKKNDKVDESVVEKYVSVDSLNIRSSKTDQENNIVGVLNKNDKVSGIIEDGWLKTEKGYINLNFLSDQIVEEKEPEEAQKVEAEKKAEEEAQKVEAEKKAEEEAQKVEAEKKAEEEAQRKEAEKKAEEEAQRKEAEKKAEEEAQRKEAEKKAEEEAQRKEAEKKAEEEAQKPIAYTGWVNIEALNVRSGAGTSSNLLGAVTKGDKLSGELKDGWLKISYNGQTGFVSADYLSDTEVAKPAPVVEEKEVNEEKEEAKAVYYTGWVNTPSLRVRSQANTYSNTIGNISKGDKVEGQLANGWLQISYNGQTAYINASYLSDTEVAKPAPIVEEKTNNIVAEKASYQNNQVSGSGQQAANIAASFVGYPYVWGGSTPSGFDCSGLVYYAYRQVGVNLNRSSKTQFYNGYSVTNLQAGDLVFFSSDGVIDHVGMIINSNGDFVHASTPSRGVVIDNIYSSWYQNSYVGAKRIF